MVQILGKEQNGIGHYIRFYNRFWYPEGKNFSAKDAIMVRDCKTENINHPIYWMVLHIPKK